MDRPEFFEKSGAFTADRLREILWKVYGRGSAEVRARVEEALAEAAEPPKIAVKAAVDMAALLAEAERFVGLARAGAYMGGTREVHPTERSRWRVTYRRLLDDTSKAVAAGDLELGAGVLEALLDLACELREHAYFHSDDPVAAMRLVVSDKVKLLWRTSLDREAFPAFVRRAAPQLIRWESRHGWTRRGTHPLCTHEVSLADVLAELLRDGELEHWISVADAHLEALSAGEHAPRRSGPIRDYPQRRRTEKLVRFHDLLLDRLFSTEGEDRLDRLVAHAELGGPELAFLKARLAHRRGDASAARKLATACLAELPGHAGFLEFAAQIEAPLPRRAQEPGRRDLADEAHR
ncbi:MAG TPA: hypothetical protein VN253_22490 [Kofleriaceae bacterium]|nr:hypothetical protein [Kofleriaceae bacterium]